MNHEGSIQHLEFMTHEEKDVFKTAFEMDQRWVIDLAADRTPYICQSQSLNIFVPADIHKRDLHLIHFTAWKKGIKSMYYSRSKSVQRADKVSIKSDHAPIQFEMRLPPLVPGATASTSNENKNETSSNNYDECLACQ
jgi:ribonucleoside-diphosphate reductase alpha chain